MPKPHHLALNASDDVVLTLIDVDLQTGKQIASQTIVRQLPQKKTVIHTTVVFKRKTIQHRLSSHQPPTNKPRQFAKTTEPLLRPPIQQSMTYQMATQHSNRQSEVENSNQTLMVVRKHLEAYKYYPASARRRGIEGHVDVSFRLIPYGAADQVSVLHGSGYAVLDHAALEAVYRAQPFPIGNGKYRFRLTFKRL